MQSSSPSMGSVPTSELSLDYRPNGYPTGLNPFGDHHPDQTLKLEEFLARLEEERLKIEAFKRELPLCMQLLNNAMEGYRQQLVMYHTNHGTTPVLEEFIPLKRGGTTADGPEESPEAEKASWMTTAQLWSTADGGGGAAAAEQPAAPQEEADRTLDVVSPKVALDGRLQRGGGGAFLPFSRERSGRGRGGVVVPELALSPVEKEKGGAEKKASDVEVTRRGSCGKVADQGKAATAGTVASDGGQAAAAAAQTHRKARRCWTPDLHRRFVSALQMLGGSQVATPKQIRELMKVDGLTNDEVKSHLQKYRLHTRRPIPTPQSAASAVGPQVVLLGGIWVPPEYATTSAAAGPVIYGAGHPAAAHFCAAPVQHDFYAAPVQPTHHQLTLQRHHEHGMAAATSGMAYRMKHESPESAVRGSQDRSESIEDGEEEEVVGDDEVEEEEVVVEDGEQSEKRSWKGGDEKALVPVK